MDKYGNCETESTPFQCKICNGIVKFTTSLIGSHLRTCHKIRSEEHLKISHRREDKVESITAFHAAEKKIDLVERSSNLFNVLYPKKLKIGNPLNVMSRMFIRLNSKVK